MNTKAGVWIDHKQAIVVLITEAGQDLQKFKSEPGQSVRPVGGTRPKRKFTPNDFVAEVTRNRKLLQSRKQVYDQALACIQGADSLLILGPGEAKGEFKKHIMLRKLRGLKVELETADKMTDRQLAATVREHFSKAPPRKSIAPKKTVPATSGKHTKQTRK